MSPRDYWSQLARLCDERSMTAVISHGFGPIYRVGMQGEKGYAEARATFYPGRVAWQLTVYHIEDLHSFDELVDIIRQLTTKEKDIVLDWEHEQLIRTTPPKSYRSEWE